MKKESRFWKKGIKVLLAIGLLGSMLVPTSAMANEYVTPGDAEEDDGYKSHVTFVFRGLNENGFTMDMQYIQKEVKLGSTLKEAGIELPTATFKDLTFLGWVDTEGNAVDENTKFNSSFNEFLPKFDKLVAPVMFTYPDSNNDIKVVSEIYLFEHGATYGDVVNRYVNYRAEDISKDDIFSGWDNGDVNMNKIIEEPVISFHVQADFKNKKVLELVNEYYDTNGLWQSELQARLVNKNTTYEDFTLEMNKLPLPESFKGLRANRWSRVQDGTIDFADTGVIKSYARLRYSPDYENYIVRFMIDDMFRERDTKLRGAAAGFDEAEVDSIYAFVAEKGDVITVPEIKEYTNIKWIYWQPEGDNLIVNGHKEFLGYGDKVDTPVVNPDDDKDNNGTDVPDVILPEEDINNAINEVKNAAKGDKVTVDMKDNVTLPVEVLESARGKDVEVVFNMGAYSWSINGLDITAATLKAINLEVKLNANTISADVVKTLAGDRPTMQLSLSHNGEFGFKAKLQVNLGAEYKGKYGNLYYYNKDGKLEFMNAGKIDENGNVSLEFTHASDYVVVIDEKSMEPKKTENPIQDTSSNTNGSAVAVMVLLTLLGGAYCLHNKKAKNI